MLADIAEGRPIHLEAGSPPPAYLPDLVHVALDLLVDGETGEWRLANPPVGDLETFARRLAEQAGAPDHTVVASRPAESSPVARARGPELMPDMAGAIDRYLRDAEFDWRRPQTHLAAAE
jgi:dTDP-4-dehydrorhamnose reductase